MAARFVDKFGDFLLREPVALGQPVVCACFFDRIEIFTLEIFDQRQRGDLTLVKLADDGRDFVNFGALRSAPAAFPSHELEAIAPEWPHHDGLDHPARSDRAGEVIERGFIEMAPRLVWMWFDIGHR